MNNFVIHFVLTFVATVALAFPFTLRSVNGFLKEHYPYPGHVLIGGAVASFLLLLIQYVSFLLTFGDSVSYTLDPSNILFFGVLLTLFQGGVFIWLVKDEAP